MLGVCVNVETIVGACLFGGKNAAGQLQHILVLISQLLGCGSPALMLFRYKSGLSNP